MKINQVVLHRKSLVKVIWIDRWDNDNIAVEDLETGRVYEVWSHDCKEVTKWKKLRITIGKKLRKCLRFLMKR